MLIVMRPGATIQQVDTVRLYVRKEDFDAHVIFGELQTVIGDVGGKVTSARYRTY